ncbi:hypothetical protein C9421_30085 [Klebsiella pneumoniae]|nr:hypothetical protein C9421_30085 [Klebsiella pneumoniae]
MQGEGGFYAASPAFMQRLRALCDEHGIHRIFKNDAAPEDIAAIIT